ncbi:MAG TPA: hypothetical protein VFK13_09305 [Gemmatimonadaceae bacterium]|nr:hypothetical protein [Gemmatimonadaceae bacterium]
MGVKLTIGAKASAAVSGALKARVAMPGVGALRAGASRSTWRRARLALACALACIAARHAVLCTQVPAPVAPPVPTGVEQTPSGYRVPLIELVQPQAGSTIPQDKPVVVFRLEQGEPGDPLDLATFRVTVDGEDRTALFKVSAVQAWGPLGAMSGVASGTASSTPPIAPGVHQVVARICSTRGVCGTAVGEVTVVSPVTPPTPSAAAKCSVWVRVVGAVLEVLRGVIGCVGGGYRGL